MFGRALSIIGVFLLGAMIFSPMVHAAAPCVISTGDVAGPVAPNSSLNLNWIVPSAYTPQYIKQGNTVLVSTFPTETGGLSLSAPSAPGVYQYVMVVKGALAPLLFCATTVTVIDDTKKDTLFKFGADDLAPSAAHKVVYFLSGETNDITGERTTRVCRLTYWRNLDGTVSSDWETNAGPPDLAKIQGWSVVVWNGNTQLCSASGDQPEVTPISSSSIRIQQKNRSSGRIAHSLTFDEQGVKMRARQIELATDFFGIPYYYKRVDGNPNDRLARKDLKLNQYFNTTYPARSIGAYRSLVLSFTATPLRLDIIYPPALPGMPDFVDQTIITPNKICVKGTPLRNADLGTPCLTRSQGGGAKFRIANLDMRWFDPRCDGRNDLSYSFCRYQGTALGFTIQLTAPGSQFIDERPFNPLYQDPESRQWIYRYSLRNLLAPGTVVNPYKVINQTSTVSGDILPAMRQAILYAESSNPIDCRINPDLCYLPPRLINDDGSLESDDAYVAHFSIGAGQVGYEATTLSDMTYQVYQFSLVGEKK